MFYGRVSYYELWVLSLCIVMFRIAVHRKYFYRGLHCLGLLSAGLFQNAWEWTQILCTMDNTIAINCFHCGQHYRTMGGVSLLCLFYQKLRLGALPSLPKAIESNLAAGPNAIKSGCQVRPKTLPKGANSVGSCYLAKPNSVGSGSAE
jgi:hypothetical protein